MEEEKFEVEVKEKPVEVPQVDLVFDEAEAQRWLDFSNARLQNAYNSILFVIEDMPEEFLGMLLTFVSRAVKGDIINRLGAVVGQGVVYFPEKLAKRKELAWLTKGEKVGKYVAFRR